MRGNAKRELQKCGKCSSITETSVWRADVRPREGEGGTRVLRPKSRRVLARYLYGIRDALQRTILSCPAALEGGYRRSIRLRHTLRGRLSTRGAALATPKSSCADRARQDAACALRGTTIRTLWKGQRLTQKDLAQRTGLRANDLSQVERGTRNVTLFNLLRLAVALGVPPSRLLHPFDTQPALLPPRADQAS
jgi:DNA-binding Xre family transcriptional regulator